MKNYIVYSDDLKVLCGKFELTYEDYAEDKPYGGSGPVVSLFRLLDYTLNLMSDEEFNLLDSEMRNNLKKIGEAFYENRVVLKKGSKPKFSRELTNAITEILLQNGPRTTSTQVKVQLDMRGIVYTERRFRSALHEVRKKLRYPNDHQLAKDVKAIAKKYYFKNKLYELEIRMQRKKLVDYLDSQKVWYESRQLSDYLSSFRKLRHGKH